MPNGFGGVMGGVAAVFFAYIGFDAVSTLAEETPNPRHDLPKGMINSLIICTAAYIILSLVLTGMVSYRQLGVSNHPGKYEGKNYVGDRKSTRLNSSH